MHTIIIVLLDVGPFNGEEAARISSLKSKAGGR